MSVAYVEQLQWVEHIMLYNLQIDVPVFISSLTLLFTSSCPRLTDM